MERLDNATVRAGYDPQDSIGYAFSQPSQLGVDFGFTGIVKKQIDIIVVAGMGGSALPARFIATWPELKKPLIVCSDYDLPRYVGQNCLVIATSYSGNTEETMSAAAQAKERGCDVVVTSHGGKLVEFAQDNGYAYLELPEAPQPRMGMLANMKAMVAILTSYGVLPAEMLERIRDMAPRLSEAMKDWLPDVDSGKNLAKRLAIEIAGKTPIVYSGPLMHPAAYKWKISFNENAKNTAWSGVFPEFNHNEFIGWSSHPVEKPFAVIDLASSFEHERIRRRFDVTDRLLSGMRPHRILIESSGDDIIEHQLYLTLLGDLTTLYLALLNGVDPTPVDLVEKFKREL